MYAPMLSPRPLVNELPHMSYHITICLGPETSLRDPKLTSLDSKNYREYCTPHSPKITGGQCARFPKTLKRNFGWNLHLLPPIVRGVATRFMQME